jgi:hypothetical protein
MLITTHPARVKQVATSIIIMLAKAGAGWLVEVVVGIGNRTTTAYFHVLRLKM